MAKFVSTVLADTEDVWKQLFSQGGASYKEPRLVLFRGAVPTACGTGQSAMGPFYCPADQKVYIDLNFYETLKTRLGAPGDFAQAYVIAHEVGHHVQNQLGITEPDGAPARPASQGAVQRHERASWNCRPTASPASGPTTRRTPRQILEQGDVEEAMNAAAEDRRRRAAGLARRRGGARKLHPRDQRPAPELVRDGPEDGQREGLRHLQRAATCRAPGCRSPR